jgi:hypothetical protein
MIELNKARMCPFCELIFIEKEQCPNCGCPSIEIQKPLRYLLTYTDEDLYGLNPNLKELSVEEFDYLVERVKKHLESVDCWVCIQSALDLAVDDLKKRFKKGGSNG